MDKRTVLEEVEKWTVDERVHLVEAVWDQLRNEGFEPPITVAQREKLDRRLEDGLDRADFPTWQSVRSKIERGP